VKVTAERCIGCKACIRRARTGALRASQSYVDKCTFVTTASRTEDPPACRCADHCMYFGDLDDPKSTVSRCCAPQVAHAAAEARTRPRVFYLT